MSFSHNHNWEEKSIDEVIQEITSGFSWAKNKLVETGIFQIRPYNITTDLKTDFETKVFVPENIENVEDYYLKKNDILFNNTNSVKLVGKTAIIEKDEKIVFSNHISRIRVDEEQIIPEWLAICLYRHWVGGTFTRISTKWIGQAGVSGAILRDVKIPVPSKPEQREIVKEIKKISDNLENVKVLRKISINETKNIMPSYLRQIFSVAKEKKWEVKELQKVSKIIMGQSPPGHSYNKKGEGTPLLNGPTEFGEKNPVTIQWTTIPKKKSEDGDILICVRGATTGRMNWSDSEYCIGRGLASLRPFDEVIPEYLYEYLSIQTQAILNQSGGKSTFPNLSKDVLSKLKIPVPSKPAQKEIVKKMKKIQEKVKYLLDLQKETNLNIDAILNATVQKELRDGMKK